MYEYEISVNGKVFEYIVMQHRISTKKLKENLIRDGYTSFIEVKFYDNLGE